MNIKIYHDTFFDDIQDASYYVWTFDHSCFSGDGCKVCPLSNSTHTCIILNENSPSFMNTIKDHIADKPLPYKTTLADLQTTFPEFFL